MPAEEIPEVPHDDDRDEGEVRRHGREPRDGRLLPSTREPFATRRTTATTPKTTTTHAHQERKGDVPQKLKERPKTHGYTLAVEQ